MKGLINVLKPPGMTSHDVVNYLRSLLGEKKIGHMGTLDPGGVGVLPVGIGKGTKLSEFMLSAVKSYRVEAIFGIRTSTQDLFGDYEFVNNAEKLTKSRLLNSFKKFTGEIYQIPPMTSAVRYRGKKLYELAREGKRVERKKRLVKIYDLKLIKWNEDEEYPKALLDVKCSKGTYIRTLVADIGDDLQTGACMSFLLRTQVGNFLLEDSWTLEEIKSLWNSGDNKFIEPLDSVVAHLPKVYLKERAYRKVINGLCLFPCDVENGAENIKNTSDWIRIYDSNGTFLALGVIKRGGPGDWCIHGKKVFSG